ncbi:uncharacterized protein LOC141643249 isoform X2 [Silene latifolia]|uniref:uncharacterized protein LOC141643249 isoform X2 n=1 Tax=Silene latifolia TaxID=37657 RepID=UPI003D7805D5
MAFHVACPITCKRICFCTLGFPRKLQKPNSKSDFLGEISRLEDFLKDPWLFRVKDGATVQVPVPILPPPPPPPLLPPVLNHLDDAAAAQELLSAQTKRAALQKKAASASLAAEDFARRFESGALLELPKDSAAQDPAQVNENVNATVNVNGNVNVMCRLCFSGEMEGTERAKKMLPCRTCGKKYHRNCLRTWSQHRDLFHWSSWACPSCRTCEVCCRTGEPAKFKFCKRCDGAFHCYCMQPPHKNVSSGPYLCPKHTKCHSCGSNVPGNGLSLRWFLGYTCCDACGRLFTKGNYCPVCLKVYRDSEATPMVCCDICQRWVHCQCDGISEERYLQFQIDGNLPYTCSTCRGECYQVRDLEDAVQELWRRRDEADKDLIASLRAAAGLPTQEEIFSISPFSDDEDNGPTRSSKFSYKSLTESSPKKIKDPLKKSQSKKYNKKKGYQTLLASNAEFKLEDHHDTHSLGFRGSKDIGVLHPDGPALISSPISGNFSSDRIDPMKKQGSLKRKYIDDITGTNADRLGAISSITNNKISDAGISEDVGNTASKLKAVKGTKLVIHLGSRNKTITHSPRSDSSRYQTERDMMALSGGNEVVSQHRQRDNVTQRLDGAENSDDGYGVHSPHAVEEAKPRERNLIKIVKGKFAPSDTNAKSDRGNGLFIPEKAQIMSSKRLSEVDVGTEGLQSTVPKGPRLSFRRHPESIDISGDGQKTNKAASSFVDASPKDSRLSLRLKLKSPYLGSWAPRSDEETVSVKGQRSKRKRPSPSVEKRTHQDEDATASQGKRKEMGDDTWILSKLGRDAIGKRVEIHQPSDNSWHKGIVSDMLEGTSILTIDLDDGRAKRLEIGKQRIRLVQPKQKKLKS